MDIRNSVTGAKKRRDGSLQGRVRAQENLSQDSEENKSPILGAGEMSEIAIGKSGKPSPSNERNKGNELGEVESRARMNPMSGALRRTR